MAVGVVQEQHLDRIRLYKQWKKLDWPIFVDQLNLLDHKVVPIPMAINANGVIVYPRLRSPRDVQVFLNKDFAPGDEAKAALPHALKGDRFSLDGRHGEAIAAYRMYGADDARAQFRLGVALRERYESVERKPGDGQAAVAAWTRALTLRPDQYIWRRRIQQYGPRLDKPYNMFGWVEQARAEIRARGEEPLPLKVEPRGTELLGKGPTPSIQAIDPDPQGKVPRDKEQLVEVESIVTPARVRPGHRVRVRLVFRVGDAFWNNEADAMSLHVAAQKNFTLAEGLLSHPNAAEAETKETRILEFELEIGAAARTGAHDVSGYALYNVCEKQGGVCLYLRKDFTVPVTVDPQAPKIQ